MFYLKKCKGKKALLWTVFLIIFFNSAGYFLHFKEKIRSASTPTSLSVPHSKGHLSAKFCENVLKAKAAVPKAFGGREAGLELETGVFRRAEEPAVSENTL